MALRLGDLAPDFDAETSVGAIKFHEFLGENWGILFSHPADFTPVCTTELGMVSKLTEEFEARNIKAIALSVDDVATHINWIKDINETQVTEVKFPIIADPYFEIAKLYDFVHPNASDRFTVRSVVVISPDKKIRMLMTYPASTGRDFNEILRVIDSLQLTDKYRVATPANWQQGDDVVVLPSVKTEDIPLKIKKNFKEIKPYFRTISQPKK